MAQTLLPATSENIAKARADHLFYTENCLKIRTKTAQLVPLVLNQSQRHIHELAAQQLQETGRIRIVILKARQPGVSTYVASRNFRRIHLYPHQNGRVISYEKKSGAELFAIYELFDRELPEDWRPQKAYQRGGQTIWYNARAGRGGMNSKILVETARDVSAGRGSTIQMLHASELAFWERADEVWVSLAQSVPDQGSEVWIESTANGVGNLFHQIWEGAVAKTNGYIPVFLPWWFHEEYTVAHLTDPDREEILETLTPIENQMLEDGILLEGDIGFDIGRHKITVEQLAWRRRTIRDKLQGDERKFRQEYPATPREAFLTSGNLFFEEDVLLDYEDHSTPPKRRGRLTLFKGAIVFRDQIRDSLRVWEQPKPNCHYVIAADTATGKGDPREATMETLTEAEAEKGGHDFSCADVVKVAEIVEDENGDQRLLPRLEHVAQLHGRIVPEQFAQDVLRLGFFYSCPKVDWKTTREPALIGVERNHSSGETVVRLLKDHHHYPRLYYNRTFNQRQNRVTTAAGFVTTVANRQTILDGLGQVLREGLFRYPNADGIREMFTFVRDPVTGKPEAQEGTHDDRVITASLSIEMAKTYVPSKPNRAVAEPEYVGSSPTGLFDYEDEEPEWQAR